MKRQYIFILLVGLFILSGCQTTSKEDRYNNMPPDKIYRLGVKNVKKSRYADAIENFEALESRYPFGEYADKAQIGAVYAYYLNEDYAAALPAVERFIRMYPRHPDVDYAYYLKGLIYFDEALGFMGKYLPIEICSRDPSSAKKAIHAFYDLIKAFPNSCYAEDAKQRIVYLRNLLADSELVAARFYMVKGAYLAAANRASFVIANFDQTPSLPEALYIAVLANRELDLPDLANDNLEVLAINYPNSDYLELLKDN
jgi:outer membrane protein assembly factor BamD